MTKPLKRRIVSFRFVSFGIVSPTVVVVVAAVVVVVVAAVVVVANRRRLISPQNDTFTISLRCRRRAFGSGGDIPFVILAAHSIDFFSS